MKRPTRLWRRVLVLYLVLLLALAWLTHTVAAQSGSVDCSKVLLTYYPQPPQAGDTIYLNAGVDSRIGNAPGYFGRWKLNGEELGSSIDEWDGCTTIVQWEYYCGGSVQHQNLIIPGADCSSRLGGRDSLIIGVLAAVALLVVVSRLRKSAAERAARKRAEKAARAERNAPRATPGQSTFCGSCGAALVPGDAFCRSCGRPVEK